MRDAADTEPSAASAFKGRTARPSVDYVLRTTQQHLVELSAQADLKASILITASSIVLTTATTRLDDRDLRWAAAVLAVGTAVALVLAILAVLPPGARHRKAAGHDRDDPLFFSDIAAHSEEEYVNALARATADDDVLYEAVARHVHELSCYLQTRKYAALRRAYLAFLAGLLASALTQAIVLLVD